MSPVLDHLAELTAFRDRDVLDVTLVGALRDLLRPEAVAIHRCVGHGEDRRWLTRARLSAGEAAASADPPWLELHELPRLEERPERTACLRSEQPLVSGDGPVVTMFPLFTDREIAGVLEVTTPAPLEADQAQLVGSMLRIYRNFQIVLDDSERDSLTGLLNRKTFDEAFMRATLPMAEGVAPLRVLDGARRPAFAATSWLGVIDIDHFKRVNDEFGHLIGDEVLLLLARLMRSSFRFHDRLYRFGGEEFVVLMRCQHAADAAAAFERLRCNVERYAFPRVGRITVSVGFSDVRRSDTPGLAFERADKAVYHAKQNGRNRVAHHAELVAQGLLPDERLADSDVELF